METNQAIISGVVIEVESQRTSPGGVAHQRFMLQHRSRQEEAGQPREVFCRILVEIRGERVARAQPLAVNDRVEVQGFLDRSSYKDNTGTRLILHAQQLRKA
ncbi:MAG: primosomal replication protein N [Gammaproteobacteria bacterium]|nr:MAG: primosomal replication protein N [Gammaproteobacteria bacterium]